jgi:hypothetical protein
MHWTEYGHQFVSDFLTEYILGEGLVRGIK